MLLQSDKTKNLKGNKMTTEVKPLSRSEREALIKDKAGWVITILAALLAINTLMGGSNSSKVLNNTIDANNTWAFYQAKSIKQTILDVAADNVTDHNLQIKYRELANRYESDKKTGEGKKELLAKAQGFEKARDDASKHSPWLTFAAMVFQLAIVLLSASILAVSNKMYKASFVVGAIGLILLSQGIWLWF